MQLSSKFKQQCEGISTQWRDELKRKAFDPLPANVLAEKLEAMLVTPDAPILDAQQEAVSYLLAKQDWWAMILQHAPLTLLYHPDQHPNRYESSIMHELGHVLLTLVSGKRGLSSGLGTAMTKNSLR